MGKLLRTRGSSTIEYMTLLVFILGAFVIFQFYILKGFGGQWKKAADAYGMGKQYDPRNYGFQGDQGGTLECQYDSNLDIWYEVKCFEANCLTTCQTDPFGGACAACKTNCSAIVPDCS